MRVILIISLLFFSLNFAHSQDKGYSDESGWGFFGSVGVVLLPDAQEDADEFSLPSVALGLEHKFNKWFGSDIELLYFQHSDEILFEGDIVLERDIRNIVLSGGGNFYLDNSSIFTPYLSLDFGVSYNNVDPKQLSDSSWKFVPTGKAGGGFDLNLGSVNVGILYDYILIGRHGEIYSYLGIDKYQGHRIELRIGF